MRTAVTFKFEAFDLCDKGDAIPYFRKEMVLLDYVAKHPGVRVDKIRESLPPAHLEDIYPGLFPILFEVLMEELEVMKYIEMKDGAASATPKGEAKLADFKSSISAEEKEALML